VLSSIVKRCPVAGVPRAQGRTRSIAADAAGGPARAHAGATAGGLSARGGLGADWTRRSLFVAPGRSRPIVGDFSRAAATAASVEDGVTINTCSNSHSTATDYVPDRWSGARRSQAGGVSAFARRVLRAGPFRGPAACNPYPVDQRFRALVPSSRTGRTRRVARCRSLDYGGPHSPRKQRLTTCRRSDYGK
jgi:hypothetical protein